MLVPLDPKNGYKPVPPKERAKWIEREGGDAGLDKPKKEEEKK